MTTGAVLSYYSQRFRTAAESLRSELARLSEEPSEARGVLQGAIKAYDSAAGSIEREEHRLC
jgi:hypothetical protein